MDRIYRFRIGIVVFLILLVAGIYSVRLFSLQLTKSGTESYGGSNTTTYEQTVPAARGEILDCHGTVLVSNRATYNVTLNSFVLYSSDDPNGYLLKLAEACEKNGIAYKDSLPLSATTPYTYTLDSASSTDQYNFRRFLLGRDWDADMTAENLAKKLRSVYNISDECTETEAREIMGLRYELDLPTYAYTDAYTLVEDVSAEQLAILKELAIPGMDVTTSTVREYNTSVGAQVLGHVGLMTSEEYTDTYKALGYSMDASVGKDGMEAAFESYLHGTDGVKVVTVASDGTVVDEYWKTEPKAGSNVVTTIDIGMQEVAEDSLASRIQELAASKAESKADGYDADAGAVVVMDVKTGEVLTSANYPTYNPSDYDKDYSKMALEKISPLRDRALMDANPPGSTFKMITAVAALRTGIGPETSVTCNGQFTKYSDSGLTLSCWIYTQEHSSHGTLDMRGALANSCNIYFYTMGDMIGIAPIDEVATAFGIGQDTGSEVSSSSGQLASEELKKKLYTENNTWYPADSVVAAIGQSDTRVTPLQLCRYVATMANKGTLYKATFLQRAVSSDFQTLVKGNDFTPVATGLLTDDEWQVIHDGMLECTTDGTAASYFANYSMAVCAKTGTAQQGSGGSDNGAFVCWAPADDPQIAIAVYVEHGASGGYFSTVAQDIMDYYFGSQDQAQETETENQLTED